MLYWWQYCLIILSGGMALFTGFGGICFVVNYTSDKDYFCWKKDKKELELKKLELQRLIAADKYAHDRKLLES